MRSSVLREREPTAGDRRARPPGANPDRWAPGAGRGARCGLPRLSTRAGRLFGRWDRDQLRPEQRRGPGLGDGFVKAPATARGEANRQNPLVASPAVIRRARAAQSWTRSRPTLH